MADGPQARLAPPATYPTAGSAPYEPRGSRFKFGDPKDPRNPIWRKKLRTASFKGAPFFVDQQGQSSGRRTVTHEYPKRDIPYAEDMGRAAYRYQMTGYVIQYPGDG